MEAFFVKMRDGLAQDPELAFTGCRGQQRAARDGLLRGFPLDELDAYTVRACQIGNASTRDKFVRFNRKFTPFFPDGVAKLSQVTDHLKAKMIRAPLVVTHKIIKRLQGIL
jgi:hypothetical protein